MTKYYKLCYKDNKRLMTYLLLFHCISQNWLRNDTMIEITTNINIRKLNLVFIGRKMDNVDNNEIIRRCIIGDICFIKLLILSNCC